MGLDKEVGTVEPRKRADLILVGGNPLESIHNIRNVKYVIADGKMFDCAELGAAWASNRSPIARRLPKPVLSPSRMYNASWFEKQDHLEVRGRHEKVDLLRSSFNSPLASFVPFRRRHPRQRGKNR